MPYYETDPRALAWFERALRHAAPRIRKSALGLLARIDCAPRARWLEEAQADPHADVVAVAVILEVLLAVSAPMATDLFESDFATDLGVGDLHWEWEYEIAVAHGVVLQGCTHRVWTASEDDQLARALALQKAYEGKRQEASAATALIVDKRVVNQYTRSPRSGIEARRWKDGHRPRYRE